MEETLKAGTHIVVDRYAFSGVAFSSAKGLDASWCRQPDVGLLKPDLVLFLDLPIEEAEKRGGFGLERYETKQLQMQVRQEFKGLMDSSWKVCAFKRQSIGDRPFILVKGCQCSPIGRSSAPRHVDRYRVADRTEPTATFRIQFMENKLERSAGRNSTTKWYTYKDSVPADKGDLIQYIRCRHTLLLLPFFLSCFLTPAIAKRDVREASFIPAGLEILKYMLSLRACFTDRRSLLLSITSSPQPINVAMHAILLFSTPLAVYFVYYCEKDERVKSVAQGQSQK